MSKKLEVKTVLVDGYWKIDFIDGKVYLNQPGKVPEPMAVDVPVELLFHLVTSVEIKKALGARGYKVQINKYDA